MGGSCDSQTANLDTGLTRQELALLTAEARLKGEFADTFDAETIEQCLHSSYDRLAWRAKVLAFLPLLAERVTRQHLRMLASVGEPTTDAEPSVLFPSFSDAGRLPVALASSTTSSGIRNWPARAASNAKSAGQVPFPAAVPREKRKVSSQLRKITTSVGRELVRRGSDVIPAFSITPHRIAR